MNPDQLVPSEGLGAPHAPPNQAAASLGLGRLANQGAYSYKMDVAYDGTAYRGWQRQPGFPSIQGVMEHALCTALREPRKERLKVCAAGRTDSGVHATGQVIG